MIELILYVVILACVVMIYKIAKKWENLFHKTAEDKDFIFDEYSKLIKIHFKTVKDLKQKLEKFNRARDNKGRFVKGK